LKRVAAAAAFAVFVACGSSSPAPVVQPPAWTQLPGTILDTLCSTLQNEGISPENLVVVKTTQPLVNGASLRSVAHVYGKDANVASLANVINTATPPLPLALADAHCKWGSIAQLDPVRNHDQMVVEFSAPLPNPFMRNEAGVMARMSIGGHDSQWYWIPLGNRKGNWAIGIVLPMDMHE